MDHFKTREPQTTAIKPDNYAIIKEKFAARQQRAGEVNRGVRRSIELVGPLVIRALVRGYAVDRRPYDGGPSQALRPELGLF